MDYRCHVKRRAHRKLTKTHLHRSSTRRCRCLFASVAWFDYWCSWTFVANLISCSRICSRWTWNTLVRMYNACFRRIFSLSTPWVGGCLNTCTRSCAGIISCWTRFKLIHAKIAVCVRVNGTESTYYVISFFQHFLFIIRYASFVVVFRQSQKNRVVFSLHKKKSLPIPNV